MVKWLKIDNKIKTRRRCQEIGVAIYYISKQAIIIGDERKCKPLSHYLLAVLARPKQETIIKYAA